ncbi:MAG: hypothetical protein ACRDQ1_11935, partial [Sciscionella sp.]
TRVSRRVFRRQTAPAVVACAVDAIALACVPDPSRLLHDLLAGTIEDCCTYCSPERPDALRVRTTTAVDATPGNQSLIN